MTCRSSDCECLCFVVAPESDARDSPERFLEGDATEDFAETDVEENYFGVDRFRAGRGAEGDG